MYNKVDLNKYGYVHPVTPYVFISAKEKIGLDLLEDEISHILFKDYETFQLGIPYDKGKISNISMSIPMWNRLTIVMIISICR